MTSEEMIKDYLAKGKKVQKIRARNAPRKTAKVTLSKR